ncbi:MAG: hypothetical protein KBS63_00410 [Clostridiales bacterium]|nr:hypothetical protein [Candidatus Crickella caballi]
MPSSINSLIVNICEGASAAHAFIVEGVAGEARSSFVQELAEGLSCQAADPADRPCGRCSACIQIKAGTNMDIYHMSMSGKQGYKVEDDVEPFIEKLSMSPYGRYRIGIIDEADLLSEIVQNKLLKTLEEPEPGSVIILAASNRDNLLQTVRSRCSLIRMSDYVGEDDESREHNEAIRDAAGFFVQTGRDRAAFCDFRTDTDKKIKSREDALEMLSIAEEGCRDCMIRGELPGEMARRIDLIETAKMDIQRQMDYKKALRRLFLEMEDIW